jgi:hypothetical protein
MPGKPNRRAARRVCLRAMCYLVARKSRGGAKPLQE